MSLFEKLKRRQSTLDSEIARQTGSPGSGNASFNNVQGGSKSTELSMLTTEKMAYDKRMKRRGIK